MSREAPDLRAAVSTRAIADAARAAVQRGQERDEGGPVGRCTTDSARPCVCIVNTVNPRTEGILLLPLEPCLMVAHCPVTVIHEAQRRTRCARRGRRGGRVALRLSAS